MGGKKPKDRNQQTDYRSCGTILGELNCLTQQPMEVTVTSETATQVRTTGLSYVLGGIAKP